MIKALICLLLLSVQGRAVLNSPDGWVFGTLPYETFPWHEHNWEYGLAASGDPVALRHGLEVRYGFLDHLEGGLAAVTDPTLVSGALRWRVGEQGQYPLDSGVYYRLDWHPQASQPFGPEPGGVLGLIVSRAWREHTFSLNLSSGRGPSSGELRGAWQSPFLAEGFRLGLEAKGSQVSDGTLWRLAPQAAYDLPGDIKLRGGVEFGQGGWTAVARISYLIFPNP
jgi:hypothetical protein